MKRQEYEERGEKLTLISINGKVIFTSVKPDHDGKVRITDNIVGDVFGVTRGEGIYFG